MTPTPTPPRRPLPARVVPAVALLLAWATASIAQEPLKLPTIPTADAAKQPVPKKADPPADKPRASNDEWKAWTPPGEPLTLGECLRIGRERQPAIDAARASLAASERGYLALFHLRKIADLISPDLPCRRRQAERGLAAACAEVLKAEQDNTYDVCRLYYTYVYATQQEQTAAGVVGTMQGFYDTALDLLKLGVPNGNINEFSLSALDNVIGKVRRQRERASTGRKQAYHALKEAVGVGPEVDFRPADTELPLMSGRVTQEQVVGLALEYRAELIQSAVVVDVTRLEVCAQEKVGRQGTVNTFASGSDLHSHVFPVPVRNGEYRPGSVPPEMPASLSGTKEDRVARAGDYLRHQEAGHRKAVGLVRLEATKTYLDLASAEERVKDAKARYERAIDIAEKARKAAQAKQDPELIVRYEGLASEAQAEYVEAVYEQVKALIAVEKVSAGKLTAAFPGR